MSRTTQHLLVAFTTVLLLTPLAVSKAADHKSNRPNIVFILADDLGARDVGCFGSKFHETPNIDRLAARGMRFTQACAASPLCSPTRASILTGQYPARIGITAPVCHVQQVQLQKRLVPANANMKAANADSVTRLKPEYVTLAEVMKEAGYATAHFGKWHLGHNLPKNPGDHYEPKDQGFDFDFPHTPAAAGPGGGYLAPWKFIKDRSIAGKPGQHIEDRMSEEAAKYIREHKDQSFYVNYWAYSVHSPWNARHDYIDYFKPKADPKNPQHNPLYAAMVRSLDDGVGRLLQAVEEAGIADRTIIVFFSDNGGWAFRPKTTDPEGFTDMPATSNLPYRSGKASLYEGGTREPCIIVWPGHVKPGTMNEALLQSIDFYPTLLAMCGIAPPAGVNLDGVDQTPALLGRGAPRDRVFCHFPHGSPKQAESIPGFLPGVYVRRGDWKLIRFFADGNNGSDRFELYDLMNDVGETKNLADQKPEVVRELNGLITGFLRDTKAVIPVRNPSYNPSAPSKPAAKAAAKSAAANPLQGWNARQCEPVAAQLCTIPSWSSVLLSQAAFGGDWTLEAMVGKDADGRPVYRGKPMDARFKNPIADEDERAFQERARHIIARQAQIRVNAGNTFFENEKRTYGYLMAQVLAGRSDAIKDLQLEDCQAGQWHRETKGIDLYACFTIKHQPRKLFYFGDLLDPSYRQRMLEGGKAWTARDPLRRAHYAFKKPGEGWGPDVKNSWVDVRNTENLYLMRVAAVYLFAEAAGNREVTAKYKDEIRRYAKALYRVGMGEWDSENYHGHSIAPLCNLYDFARDDEVRLLAKASLDWVFAAGAVKYYRGAFNGPTKRDYNHIQPFGGSAANMLWVHFGDCPPKQDDWESDEVHLITSSYRPPPAVLHLARKRFQRPVEIHSSKPSYTASTTGDLGSAPEYLETQYFGTTYQMGSISGGTSEDGGDVNGFKILVHSARRGAESLQCVPGPDPLFAGSPAYQRGKVAGPNRVAQHGNLAIWLVRNGKSPWRWLIPDSVHVTREKDVTFLECERTWVAIRGLGVGAIARSEELTRQVTEGKKPRFPGHQVLAAEGQTGRFCGLAMEVGDQASHNSYSEFRRRALAADVDVSRLSDGEVDYRAAGGRRLRSQWNDNPKELGVWRDGKPHDWQQHARYQYWPSEAQQRKGPIYARWGDGTLYVEAGGEAFGCRVADDGQVAFHNGKPEAVLGKLPAER